MPAILNLVYYTILPCITQLNCVYYSVINFIYNPPKQEVKLVRYNANCFFPPANSFVNPIKTKLVYTLKPMENTLVFQVHEQSADISAFLAKNTYRASNGILIAADKYPEFKDSGDTDNVNIVFLHGKDYIRNAKLDVTRFVGSMQRDKRKLQIEDAIQEFVGYIKSLRSSSYVPDYFGEWEEYSVIVL